jgi:REP element-mobilizing transposase RayT
LHVTLRAREGLPPFREAVLTRAIRGVIAASNRAAFRVLHFSVQDNHVHLVVEAHDKAALSHGMQWLAARAAKRLNWLLRIRGGVWRERYHARELTTPRSVRNALVYVLMNVRKHHASVGPTIDPCSSAPWFVGFTGHNGETEDSPVCAPRTWLAGVGWRRHGLLRLDERPRAPA